MQWRQPCSIHLCDEHGCIQPVDAGGETTRQCAQEGYRGRLKSPQRDQYHAGKTRHGKSPKIRSKPLGPCFAAGKEHQREYGHGHASPDPRVKASSEKNKISRPKVHGTRGGRRRRHDRFRRYGRHRGVGSLPKHDVTAAGHAPASAGWAPPCRQPVLRDPGCARLTGLPELSHQTELVQGERGHALRLRADRQARLVPLASSTSGHERMANRWISPGCQFIILAGKDEPTPDFPLGRNNENCHIDA